MRVVDEHRERLSLVDPVEASGDAVDGLDALLDRLLADPERACGGDGSERVLDVETPRELQAQLAETITWSKVIASGSSAASRCPYSSPTLITACAAWANRRRFDSKYSSIVPWKSR